MTFNIYLLARFPAKISRNEQVEVVFLIILSRLGMLHFAENTIFPILLCNIMLSFHLKMMTSAPEKNNLMRHIYFLYINLPSDKELAFYHKN